MYDLIQADETSLIVINNDKVKSYLWVYCCGADSHTKITEDKITPSNKKVTDIPSQVTDAIVFYDYQQVCQVEGGAVNYLDELHRLSGERWIQCSQTNQC